MSTTTKPEPLTINEPVAERFRANVVNRSFARGDEVPASPWRESYGEAQADVANVLLNAGTGAVVEIEKVFITQSTAAAWAAREPGDAACRDSRSYFDSESNANANANG